MNVCSSAAQEIRKAISEVLSSRSSVVITEVDPTSDLEESLSKKIADFENVVNGCFPTQTLSNSSRSGEQSNSNIKPVQDISKEKRINVPEKQVETVNHSSPSVPIADINEDKSNCDNSNVIVDNSEQTEALEGKSSAHVEKQGKIQTETSIKTAGKVSVSSEEDKVGKKHNKAYSNKKKAEKTLDQVIKSLSSCSTSEEKFQALCKKYVEVVEESRVMEPRLKQLERQVMTQQREKEQLQAEHNRLILAKSRLESLCRELQKQGKITVEESLLRIKEEEEKRKEVANRFQSHLNDICVLMQENSKKNVQLREENTELAKKLKALVDHYEMWEKHMEKVVQQKDLETQLAKAKHAKINLLLKQETEKFLREKQSLLENMSDLQKKCTVLTSNELTLRTELADYTAKYEEFQTILNKSSQVFASFKNDMESTSKKIKKLEKETNVYKQKWENSNNALLNMISDKEKHDKELTNAQQRILTLEKLCRALQAERNELQSQLNAASTGSLHTAEKEMAAQSPETAVA
ncbi:alpha-taxilin-like [Uloborus diversus]|uniref:alpha-taxilin-like n=1 Tax=Uloborus diversus TaxID=327109 RepID=UPI002409FA1B|nr:alpha-taxilin-like [Uloborus diversus]